MISEYISVNIQCGMFSTNITQQKQSYEHEKGLIQKNVTGELDCTTALIVVEKQIQRRSWGAMQIYDIRFLPCDSAAPSVAESKLL